FFFSSRRRHTRFSRDWSSDVCSSDLRPCCSIHIRTSDEVCYLISTPTLSLNSHFRTVYPSILCKKPHSRIDILLRRSAWITNFIADIRTKNQIFIADEKGNIQT